MSFSLSGLASGLDTNTIISQLMQLEKQPLLKIQSRQQTMKTNADVFRSINTKLKTLQDAASDLLLSSNFKLTSVTNTDDKVVKVTSGDSAVTGNYQIEVVELAAKHAVKTNEWAAAGSAAALKDKTIRIFAAGMDEPLEITIQEGTYKDVLTQIKDEINQKAKGITASVIETSPGKLSLVLTSAESGQENAIQFGTVDPDNPGTGATLEDTDGVLQALGLLDAEGKLVASNEVTKANNAIVKINGLQIERSTNEIKDVIGGVTLNLLDKGTSTVTAGIDGEKVAEKIDKFVKAYNDVVNTIRSNTGKEKRLQGDSTLRQLDASLYNWVTAIANGTEEGYRTLAEIGLEIDKGITSASLMTGTISFDKEKFLEKFAQNPEAVYKLFSADDTSPDNRDGIARVVKEQLQQWTKTVNGIITARITGYEEEISLMNDQIDRFNERLVMKEEQLRKQFTAMEVALAQLQSQQSWMMSQLAQISANSAV
jgi:flagellar hook-associated protein 2